MTGEGKIFKWKEIRKEKGKGLHINLVPRALFPGIGGGAGKGPGIGRSIRYFDWLIDLGNLCKKMTK